MVQLFGVFQSAGVPQKIVLVVLVACILWAVIAGALPASDSRPKQRNLLIKLALVGPALGLLVAALNAFHMMQTTLRLPNSPTAKDLAPGVMEIATFVGLGALCGLVAIAVAAWNDRTTPPAAA